MKMFSLVALLGLSAFSSFATQVTYSTLGSTLCPDSNACAGTSVQLANVIVTFNAITTSTVDALPTTVGQLGSVDFDCFGAAEDTTCASQSVAGLNLNILVTQTVPSGGSGTIIGSFSGSVAGTTSSAVITWTTPNITIGAINYNSGFSLPLSPPSSGNGITTVNALITDTSVPEPSTYAMIGGALLGLGYLRRRKA